MVSESVLNFLMEIGVLSFILPVGVLLVYRIRTKKSFKPEIAGAGIYLFFGLLLKRIPDTIFLYLIKPSAVFLHANPLCYAVYLGIVAAVFEETGRYLVYRYYFNKDADCYTAVSCGIGHGGTEWIVSLGITDLSYYVFATVYNQNRDTIKNEELIMELKKITVNDLVLNGIMRILFFVIQICLAVMILQAYRNAAERKRYFLIAALTHLAAYLPDGLYQQNLIRHGMALFLLAVVLVFSVLFSKEVYRGMKENDQKKEKEAGKKTAAERHKNFSYAKKKYTNLDTKK